MNDSTIYPDPARAGRGGTGWSAAALRKRWWLYAVLIAVAVVGALALEARRPPTYSAQAQLLITPLDRATSQVLPLEIRVLRDTGEPERNLQTATTLLSSPQIATETAQRVGGTATSRTVQQRVTVEALGGSNVAAIVGTGDTPEQAAALANAYADAAVKIRNQEISAQARSAIRAIDGRSGEPYASQRGQLRALRDQGDPTVTSSQAASVPSSPDGPPVWATVVLAVLLAGALATAGAVLLEHRDRRVRDRAELLRRIPVPVLAAVPAPPRGHRGIDMPPAVREAFRTLQIQLDLRDHQGCRKILVTSANEGDGKTTTVLNLAFALISAGHRVIVVDFDLRKPDLLQHLGLDGQAPGLAESLTTGASLGQIMRAAPRLPPLRVVSAASDAGRGDVALLPALARRMQAVLAEAEAQADYVLIDTAPLGEVGDALAIAEHVDDVLLVGRPGSTDRGALDTMAGLLQRAGVATIGWVIAGAEATSTRYHEEPDSSKPSRRRRSPVA